jgi:murein DD-endopeptidase MepM/ murein hydrolase activator NlpD
LKTLQFLALLTIGTVAAGLCRDRLEWLSRSSALSRLSLPFREAALLAKSPDATILMPLAGIRTRHIADTWHARRGAGRQHEGQDLFARRGTPVYSAGDGIVVRIGSAGIGGNAVSILGAGGRVYYYAHLSRFGQLKMGDYVTSDTVVGYVGNTGNAASTPPHLHFGVYDRGSAINPLPLLTERQSYSG